MALASKMMGGGVPAGMAKAINGDVASALSGAGTVQGDATAINSGIAVFTTVAASSGGILPSCEIGDSVEVLNFGANTLTLYPDSGARINAVATNGGVSLATNTAMRFVRFTSTRWMAFLSS